MQRISRAGVGPARHLAAPSLGLSSNRRERHPRRIIDADTRNPKPSPERRCTVQESGFLTLLYRYFFFEWLFQDVRRGTMLERANALRYNQSQAHWLLVYMRRWVCCTVVLYGLGGCVELLIGSIILSVPFYVLATFGVTGNAVIATAWLGLKFL